MRNEEQMNKNEVLLNSIIRLMETDKSADAPAASILWTKNLFRSRVVEPKKSIVERLVAVLKLDLGSDKLAFGERSGAPSATRQMLFTAGETKIDVRFASMEKGFGLFGQVLGDGFAGAVVKIAGDAGSFTAEANEMSEFKFVNIPKGLYNLSLSGTTQEIVIEDIKIG